MTSTSAARNWRTSCSDTAFSRTCASLGLRSAGARRRGVHGEVGRGVGDQVQVVHLGAGVGRPGGRHLGSELARDGWVPVMAESM